MPDKDPRVNIRPFVGEVLLWSETWVSQGHFMVRKSWVRLGDRMTSDDALVIAFPKALTISEKSDKELHELIGNTTGAVLYDRSPWQLRDAVLYLGPNGEMVWFDRDYLDAFDIGALYGTTPERAFMTAATLNDSNFVLMPVKQHVTASEWRQIAACVAAGTVLEPEPSSDVVDDAIDKMMDDLADSDGKSANAIRPKSGSVTISAKGVSRTIKALEDAT